MHLLTNFVVISFKHAKPTLYFRNMHKKKNNGTCQTAAKSLKKQILLIAVAKRLVTSKTDGAQGAKIPSPP